MEPTLPLRGLRVSPSLDVCKSESQIPREATISRSEAGACMTASASDETRDSRILREKKAMFVMSRFRPLSHKPTLTGSLESVRQCLRLRKQSLELKEHNRNGTTTKRHSLRRRLSAFIILASSLLYFLDFRRRRSCTAAFTG